MTQLTCPREFSDKHPASVVTAVDRRLEITPDWLPPNVIPEFDDIDGAWTYESERFDFIHARQLSWLANPNKIVQETLRCLRPGGWFECRRIRARPRPQQHWRTWQTAARRVYETTGRALDCQNTMRDLMEEAGFEEHEDGDCLLPSERSLQPARRLSRLRHGRGNSPSSFQ